MKTTAVIAAVLGSPTAGAASRQAGEGCVATIPDGSELELTVPKDFAQALEIARKLTSAVAHNRPSRELKNLVRPKLLILDQVGYLALGPTQASCSSR